jgi:hypothetical protein
MEGETETKPFHEIAKGDARDLKHLNQPGASRNGMCFMTILRRFAASAALTAGLISGIAAIACEGISQANPGLPNPLITRDGRNVVSVDQWERVRRPELLELFREHVYGRNPFERPDDMRMEVLSTRDAFDGLAVCKQVRITCTGTRGALSFPLTVYIPKKQEMPRGCFLLIVNRVREIITRAGENPQQFWPVGNIVERGYATAAFHNSDIAPDDKNDNFKSGVFGIYETGANGPGESAEARAPDAWGAIAAWSWGASRAIDYLVTEPALRGAPVAVVGHSRGGKAALWCGAQDVRVALAIGNNSGNSGAALARTTRGETVGKINERFPHWFARNYHACGADVSRLPVDQHELLALVAPRRVYVASASGDAWADPVAEYRACVEAAPVYQLYGLAGTGSPMQPGIAQPLHDGAIGYHLRKGKHDLTVEDWRYFMDYADRHCRAFLHPRCSN